MSAQCSHRMNIAICNNEEKNSPPVACSIWARAQRKSSLLQWILLSLLLSSLPEDIGEAQDEAQPQGSRLESEGEHAEHQQTHQTGGATDL
ncbi:hypothetical protein MHYP_G00057640 [Metynnis hypsauchen]